MMWLFLIYLIGIPPMWRWIRRDGGMNKANALAIALWPLSLATYLFMYAESRLMR